VYPRVARAWRGIAAAAIGTGALSVGASIHLAGVIRNQEWTAGAMSGIAVGLAGAVLLVLGVTLMTAAIRRRRYRC
jgi:hypothetical protein